MRLEVVGSCMSGETLPQSGVARKMRVADVRRRHVRAVLTS